MNWDLGAVVRAGFKGAGLGAALFGATSAGAWWQLFRRPMPQTEGEVRVQGLEGVVDISRDRWGMVRVRAQSPHDIWFGQGLRPRPGSPLAVRRAAPRQPRAASRRSPAARASRSTG